MMALERWFLPIHIAFGALITFSGYFLGGMELALSWLVWAVCVRMVFLLHVTWCVNSASHIWGYKNYETRDESRNLWWVAILAHGEGWHNNHHALPRLAQHGHKWWEFDITYQVIRLLRAVGLAKNVVDLASMEQKKRSRAERTAA
jgi:stearoyl-CoA desaturase (delta-9 desaturase)